MGKSSSMFIYSNDRKFVVKTISKTESKQLRDMLTDYYNHLYSFPNSFLMKFYGHHRIHFSNGKKIVYFVVLGNVLCTAKPIHEIYDLKVTIFCLFIFL